MHKGLIMERIPVAGPWITEREIAYVTDAVTNAWYDKANMYQERFEQTFAAYVGRRHAVSLPSCTSGLHLALLALGIGPGDEVVVPDITWIATAAPISYVGATPVFADVDRQSWCLDATALAAVITPRTKAVIVVDLYGNMPDMNAIQAVADRQGVALIEDAAEAVGSTWRGRSSGSFGVFSAFSFHGSKTLTTGEGGMLLTDDESLYHRCLVLRDHGRPIGDTTFFNREVGFKYKMSAMQAALGLAQLERIDELIARKRNIFAWSRDKLADLAKVTLNSEAPEVHNTYWMVTAVLDPVLGWTKEALVTGLREQGVDCRPFFYPLSMLPAYAGFAQAKEACARNTVSYAVSPYGINLPSALNLDEKAVASVCACLHRVLDRPPLR
jgi:perosamine synthetase